MGKVSCLRSKHAHEGQSGYGAGVLPTVLSVLQERDKNYLGGWKNNRLQEMMCIAVQVMKTVLQYRSA